MGVDPLITFVPSASSNGARFGTSVVMRSQYIAIAAPGIKSVFTYNWNSVSGWQNSGILVNNNDPVGDGFGIGLSLTRDGLRLAVGSPRNNTVYVYSRPTPTGAWVLEASLTANDIPPPSIAGFGARVGIISRTSSPDNILIVGAPGIFTNDPAAYIFTRTGTIWQQVQKLQIGVSSGGFGASVDVSTTGDRILVGDPIADLNRGNVHVFRRSFLVWELEKTITASDGVSSDYFGSSVSFGVLENTRIIIGAPNANVGAIQDVGKSYIFDYNNVISDWQQSAILAASGVELVANSNLGRSVAMSRLNAAMGAPKLGSSASPNVGAVFLSAKPGSGPWTAPSGVVAPQLLIGDEFGTSVSVYPASIDTRPLLLVGVPFNDVQGPDAGLAILYAITA